MLEIQNAICGYRGRHVLNGISLHVNAGEVVAVLGENGAGKTTLFKSIMGHIPLLGGNILLDGRSTANLTRREAAQCVGYVPQAHTPPFPYTVEDVVVMGRTAYISLFAAPSRKDEKLAGRALETLGISHLAPRVYTDISGGERQMVLIARALAQEPSLLLLDEPTSNLDFGNQYRILQILRSLADLGMAVLMTTHHPEHVLQCADRAVIIRSANEIINGRVEDVMTASLLSEVYHIPRAVCEAQLEVARHMYVRKNTKIECRIII